MTTSTNTPVLEVIDLSLRYQTRQGEVQAVEGVSFELARGSRWDWWESRVAARPRLPPVS